MHKRHGDVDVLRNREERGKGYILRGSASQRLSKTPTTATARQDSHQSYRKDTNCTLQHRTDGNGGEQDRPQPYRKARRHGREILDRLALVVLRGLFGHEGALKTDGSCPEDEAHVATLSLGITSGSSAVPSWLLAL